MLERATKRYTALAPLVLPPLLAALAKLPPGVVRFFATLLGALGFFTRCSFVARAGCFGQAASWSGAFCAPSLVCF